MGKYSLQQAVLGNACAKGKRNKIFANLLNTRDVHSQNWDLRLNIGSENHTIPREKRQNTLTYS